jgi:hypothetical protein
VTEVTWVPRKRTPADPAAREAMFRQFAARYPHIIELATADGQGCDDQFEFEFTRNVLLDGFERLHQQNWRSTEG